MSELLRSRYGPIWGITPCSAFVSGVERLSKATRESILEHESVEMVGLMLKTTSKCSGADDFNVITKLILASTDGVVRTHR
jgi:hypothetical protein